MIGYVRGQVAVLGEDQVIVDVGGVGYRAFVPHSTRVRLPPVGEEVLLWTFLQVREDALTLFGFKDQDEYQLFELLQSVSGIGPKLALSILSAVTPETFRLAVAREDFTLLTKVPGVGRKTAQRMCLELKDKVGDLPAPAAARAAEGLVAATAAGDVYGDAAEALLGLGYSRAEVAMAVEKLRQGQEEGPEPRLEALVRQGLTLLARRL